VVNRAIRSFSSADQTARALRLQGVEDPRISTQSAHEDVKISSLRTGYLYAHDIPLVLISLRGWVHPRATVRQKDSHPTEIEPATFWLVAQCLKQLRHCVPLLIRWGTMYVSRMMRLDKAV
jgi:hypothetical protein